MSRGRSSIRSSILENLPRDQKLLLAVSGGIDSMVLLHACFELRRVLRAQIGVVHVDHGLRATSSEDAKLVRGFCEEREIPCTVHALGPKVAKGSVELWARKERYRVIGITRRAENFDWALTAHTASDLVETYLMRVLANRQPGALERCDRRRKLYRPLLSIFRAEIEGYAAQFDVPFREDETNAQTIFLRNKVRHQLLPVLRKEWGDVVEYALAARAERASSDDKSLWRLARQRMRSLTGHSLGTANWLKSIRELLQGEVPAVRWRVVSLAVAPWLGGIAGPELSERILRVILGTATGVSLSGGGSIRRRKGELVFLAEGLVTP